MRELTQVRSVYLLSTDEQGVMSRALDETAMVVDADRVEQCVSSQPQKVLHPLVTIIP